MPELEIINFDKRPTLEQLRELVPYGVSLSLLRICVTAVADPPVGVSLGSRSGVNSGLPCGSNHRRGY